MLIAAELISLRGRNNTDGQAKLLLSYFMACVAWGNYSMPLPRIGLGILEPLVQIHTWYHTYH